MIRVTTISLKVLLHIENRKVLFPNLNDLVGNFRNEMEIKQ